MTFFQGYFHIKVKEIENTNRFGWYFANLLILFFHI